MSQLPWKKACLTFLLLLMFFSVFVPAAYAENKGEEISGSSDGDTYFTVVTEPGAKKCYLEIRQKRGVMAREPHSVAGYFFTRKAKMYERYLVTVEKLVGYSVVSTEEYQTEVKTFRLNLDPGCVYRVKVTPLYVTWAKKMEDKAYALVNGYNNPYTLQLDFFDLDKEHSFLDTVVIDIQRGNWMPKGWIEPATWSIRSTKGIRSVSKLDVWPEAPSPSAPVIEPEPAAPAVQPDLPEPAAPAAQPDLPEPAAEPEPPAPAADSGLQKPEEPRAAVSGNIIYDPDLAISKAPSILDSVPKNGSRGASYVSKVLRAGGLEKIQEKGAGDLIDHLNDPKNWGRSIGTVLVDPRYDQLKKGDVLACVCEKGSGASDCTNGHGKGKGLYYGLQNFIVSEVGADYVKVYSATEHRYNTTVRLSCNGGDFEVACNKCGSTRNVRWIAFSFADDIIKGSASESSTAPAEAYGWFHFPDSSDEWAEGDWYCMSGEKNLTGWQEINGWTYYFLPDGRMATGITTIGGVPYYFMEHPYGTGPSEGSVPDSGFLCRGGFFSTSRGPLVFTDDQGVVLAWDGYMSPDQQDFFEHVIKAYEICYDTPDLNSCAFYDLDGDGVKEFITNSGGSMADMVYTFYRVDYAKGAYVRIGREYGYENSLVSDPKTGHLLIELVHTGWQYVYEITYDGNAVRSREIAARDSEDGGYLYFGSKVYEYTFTGPMDYPETAEFYPEGPAAEPAPEPPKQAAASPIPEMCDFFSVTLPASWADRYVISIPDVGIVQFFNKANYEAGCGGLLFSVYATTRVRTHMQLLDFTIDRRFPLKNGGAEVGCKYLDAWENGLVFALYDGFYTFHQNDLALSSDYWEMYREIGAVLGTFQLDKERVRGLGEYMESIEREHTDWPYYGKIYTGPLF